MKQESPTQDSRIDAIYRKHGRKLIGGSEYADGVSDYDASNVLEIGKRRVRNIAATVLACTGVSLAIIGVIDNKQDHYDSAKAGQQAPLVESIQQNVADHNRGANSAP